MKIGRRLGVTMAFWLLCAVPVWAGQKGLGGFDVVVGPGTVTPAPTAVPTKEPEPICPTVVPTKEPEPPRPTAAPTKEPEPPRPTAAPTKEPEPPRPTAAPTKEPKPPCPTAVPPKKPEIPRPTAVPTKEPELPGSTAVPTQKPEPPRPMAIPTKKPKIPCPTTVPTKKSETFRPTVTPVKEPKPPRSTAAPTKKPELPCPTTEPPKPKTVVTCVPVKEKESSKKQFIHSKIFTQDLHFLPEITITNEAALYVLSFQVNGQEVDWHWEGEKLLPDAVELSKGKNTITLLLLEEGHTLWEMEPWEFWVL